MTCQLTYTLQLSYYTTTGKLIYEVKVSYATAAVQLIMSRLYGQSYSKATAQPLNTSPGPSGTTARTAIPTYS